MPSGYKKRVSPTYRFYLNPEAKRPELIKGQCRGDVMGSVSKFAAGVAFGASLGCALAAVAQVSRHDGAFWGRLDNRDKAAYVAGYSDATHSSLGQLDNLKLAAGVFHWKGADKILAQVARGLDISTLPTPGLIAYLDRVYSNPRYGDFDLEAAIELAAMRGIDAQPASRKLPAVRALG
jgi:hypothetical protein